jgi:hypothetical protein
LDGSLDSLVGDLAANPVWSPDGRFVVYQALRWNDVSVKSGDRRRKRREIPELVLAAPTASCPAGRASLLFQKGDVWYKNFSWSTL